MSKTIAALAAAASLLLAHAAPASAISLANPAMMVGQGGISHEVSYRHGVVVVRGVDYYNGFPWCRICATWLPLLPRLPVSPCSL